MWQGKLSRFRTSCCSTSSRFQLEENPNQLDSLGGDGLARAIYVPDGAGDIYYSAKDEEGIRNIYCTHLSDSLWSVPALINERMTSSSDEIYPMLSPDGQSLYFASKGLYGMGGYDLYVSQWNKETGDWDVPVNMGFPYSSPYDDFLFVNTADGKYSIFASNRGAPATVSQSMSLNMTECLSGRRSQRWTS